MRIQWKVGTTINDRFELNYAVEAAIFFDELFHFLVYGHDIEQFEYLGTSGYGNERFQTLSNIYKTVSSKINWPKNDGEVIPLADEHQELLKDTYNRSIHVLEAPELPGSTLSDNLDIENITKNYFKHKFGLTFCSL